MGFASLIIVIGSIATVLCQNVAEPNGKAELLSKAQTYISTDNAELSFSEVFDVTSKIVVSQEFSSQLKSQLTSVFIDSSVSQSCLNHTSSILDGIILGKMWANQMVDATGKLESGLLLGNLFWLGNYDQCMTIQGPVADNDSTLLFSAKYFKSVIAPVNQSKATSMEGLEMGLPGLQWGVCLPDSCTKQDVSALINRGLSSLSSTYEAKVTSIPESFPLTAEARTLIVILSLLGVVLLVGTVYDLLVYQRLLSRAREGRPLETAVGGSGGTDAARTTLTVDEYTPLVSNKMLTTFDARDKIGLSGRILVAVSVYSNGLKLLSMPRADSNLGVIHGLRFISMTWVILGHTYVFGMTAMQNLGVIPEVISRWSFQPIASATVSVDTFFLLSGTLVSYLLLNQLKKVDGPRHVKWHLFYFHRFWRLTPVYMLILGGSTALSVYWGNGPLWPPGGLNAMCRTDWWANLIYLNNLIPNHKACMAWAWYLANDMQFFIISPIFIILLYMWPWVGLVATLVVTLISSITIGIITVDNNYPAEVVVMFGNLNQTSTGLAWFDDVYQVPWCRIGPYMIGILLGYILYKTDRKVTMHWGAALCGWVLAAVTALALMYGLYDVANGHPLSSTANALYASVHRTLWAVAVAWVIFACITGYGGAVNSLLSWSAFIPLSRLTYVAYLIHPLLMYTFYLSRRAAIFLDDLQMAMLFCGFVMVTYGLAFILSLALEAPFIGLEKVIFPTQGP